VEQPRITAQLPPSARSLVRMAAVFYAVTLALAWLWARFVVNHPLFFRSTEAAERGLDPPRDVGLGLAAGALVILASAALTRLTGWGERLAQALAELIGPLELRHCLALAALSGVAEEALFRGALQPQVGLLAASVLFALAHLAPRRELVPWCLFSFAAGLLFGILYERTGNLVAPVLAHALVNAVNLRLLSARFREPAPPA
jgi:membrane protease YdiL (CAAX protease family)